jgi:hypothetical protein
LKVNIKEVHGLQYAAEAVRMSFDSHSKMEELVGFPDFQLWKDDVALLSGLIAKGDSHAKVMRFVDVYMRVNAPRYFWQEFDTYGVGVVRMSRSTVHKILARPLTTEDFDGGTWQFYLEHLNELIKRKDLLRIKKDLPENFLQERFVKVNYQALRHMYHDRKNHKLPEWHTFLDAVSLLPFFEEFIKVSAKCS